VSLLLLQTLVPIIRQSQSVEGHGPLAQISAMAMMTEPSYVEGRTAMRFLTATLLAASLALAPMAASPAFAATKKTEATDTTAKPKRERSEAQKKNDQIMRDCGAEWRAKDDTFKKSNKWVNFLKDCRARKKGA
jgi:predicted lipid-binding transport protein (Tim44 family)